MTAQHQLNLKLVAPPPVLYVSLYLSGALIHLFMPVPVLLRSSLEMVLAGVLLFGLSAILARWSFMTMRQSGTMGNPRQVTRVLVTSGPFQFSRNPVYLAMTGMYLGLCLIHNALWPLLFIVPLLLIMEWGVIRREEAYLTALFGDTYLQYKQQVRRWM